MKTIKLNLMVLYFTVLTGCGSSSDSSDDSVTTNSSADRIGEVERYFKSSSVDSLLSLENKDSPIALVQITKFKDIESVEASYKQYAAELAQVWNEFDITPTFETVIFESMITDTAHDKVSIVEFDSQRQLLEVMRSSNFNIASNSLFEIADDSIWLLGRMLPMPYDVVGSFADINLSGLNHEQAVNFLADAVGATPEMYEKSINPVVIDMVVSDDPYPFWMVNLIDFYETAQYADGRDDFLTGKEANARYSEVIGPALMAHNSGAELSVDIEIVLTPSEIMWENFSIAKYASRDAFINIFQLSPEVNAGLEHKWAGVENTLVYMSAPESKIPYDYGEQTKLKAIPVGNLSFEVLVAGPASGEAVILLHGFPQTAHSYRQQITALADAGYYVIAPNQRGYSLNARPVDADQYHIDLLIKDVFDIALALGADQFHLVGHDWGGRLAWEIAGRYPERLYSLTVLSTPHTSALLDSINNPLSDQSQRSSYTEFFVQPGSELQFLTDDAAILRSVYHGLPQEAINEYLRVLGNESALKAALDWYRGNSLDKIYEDIKVPTLYIWSDNDNALGPDAAFGTEEYIKAPYQFEVLEGIGHWIPELASETTTALLINHINKY